MHSETKGFGAPATPYFGSLGTLVSRVGSGTAQYNQDRSLKRAMESNVPRHGPGGKRNPENRSQGSTPVHPKKGRSQEKQREPKEEDAKDLRADMDDVASHDNQIHDILDDIRDLKDQMKSSQSQLAFLLYNEADRQRSAVAGKVMVKNWWQYNDPNEQGKHLLMEHRETMINAIAVEAGFSEKEITRFRFEHRRGKQLSPFTMVDLGDFALKQQLLESVNQKYDKKGIKEYSNEKLNHLQSGNNKDSVNGTIKIEPCISAFDRMQTEPLKAIMAVITKMTPTLQWKHSWKHLTIQNTDSGEYIAWLAYDHLEGMAKIYVNSTFYSARAFEDEFIAAYGNIMSRKVIGNKGKGKGNAAEGVLTTGDFLKAVGLTPEGKGSYVKVSTLTLKTKVPFIFDVRAIKNDEFGQKYDEHLNRIAKRILKPDLVL